MNIINFPVLNIYEFFCEESLAKSFNEKFLEHEVTWKSIGVPKSQLDYPSEYGYLNTGQDNYFFYEPWFNWAQKCISEVSSHCLDGLPLEIVDYWFTKSTFGQKSQEHRHSFSLLSGLYYMTDQEKTTTSFHHENLIKKYYELFFPEPKKIRVQIQPEQGKLIIFPSFLLHNIDPNKDKNTRHTMAFNTFVNGKVSDIATGKLNLEIKR